MKKISKKTIQDAYIALLKSKKPYALIKFNDKNYILTKEYSLFCVDNVEKFDDKIKQSLYYHTEIVNSNAFDYDYYKLFKTLCDAYLKCQKPIFNGTIFGTVAVKIDDKSFMTTERGKKSFDNIVIVNKVDHMTRTVYANKKATLNAPLLDYIFKNNPDSIAIVHTHTLNPDYETLEYEMPGTNRDSLRNVKNSFNIEHHGSFTLIRK